jgi:DNA-binding CsgD family transcriptional regulator
MIEQIPLDVPLTERQLDVARLLALGISPAAIAVKLAVQQVTIEYHIAHAAEKIPGDLPRTARVVAWYRGAPLSVLVPPTPLQRALASMNLPTIR